MISIRLRVIEVGVGDRVVGRQFMCSSTGEINFSCVADPERSNRLSNHQNGS